MRLNRVRKWNADIFKRAIHILPKEMERLGLDIRCNSKLCNAYIHKGNACGRNASQVATRMAQVRFLFEFHPTFHEQVMLKEEMKIIA